MADIDLYDDGSGEDINEGEDSDAMVNVSNFDENYDYTTGEDLLTPLQRFQKNVESDNILTRQMVARGILETLRQAVEFEDDVESILSAIMKLSEDIESTIRAELMEQIPHVAVYCREVDTVPFLDDVVSRCLLPIIVQYLTDPNNQVRKTSQAALLVLLEQGLISSGDIEEQVCPRIIELTEPDTIDDYRTEAAALMTKMTPMVSRDITEKLFLHRFISLCSDPLFHVRKVCAANFGDMCGVVGQETTEKHLLPKFYYLCEDGVWGVRKTCAECFTAVSCACSQETRKSQLTNLFVELICDQSRWVRMSAFQALGPFISTFADPSMTGLYFDEDGVLCVGQVEPREQRDPYPSTDKENQQYEASTNNNSNNIQNKPPCDNTTSSMDTVSELEDFMADDISLEERLAGKYFYNKDETLKQALHDPSCDNVFTDIPVPTDSDAKNINTSSVSMQTNTVTTVTDTVTKETNTSRSRSLSESSNGDPNKVHIHLDNTAAFSSFQFWRAPLPEIDLDFDLVEGKPTNIHVTARVKDDEHQKVYSTEMEVKLRSDEEADANEYDLNEAMANLNMLTDQPHNKVRINTASISTVSEQLNLEEPHNIGSTHVLGQHLNECTMTIVNGVVKDVGHIHNRFYDDNSPGGSTSDDFHEDKKNLLPQNVIPQVLLDNYLSMTDPARAQTVDTEIARHCAHSLPAVAYTLGREYWYCLKDLYETLANDMQWKVRRTLAFSIHEIAIILGEDIVSKDLVPVFDGFLKDLDEVRIGVLRHLADFLKLLKPWQRQTYLNRIPDFMTTDNHRNWRFRLELAEQLIQLCDLYVSHDIHRHILPIGLALAEDKVYEVRQTAIILLSAILKKFTKASQDDLMDSYISYIMERFASSNKWVGRQTYGILCYHILRDNSVHLSSFADVFLPKLLSMTSDLIPNVRITVARAVSQAVLPIDYFTQPDSPCHDDLIECLHQLQNDLDRDVKYYALLPQQQEILDHKTIQV